MRALLIVLDGVGIGGAPDAAEYGDEGANTLGHIFEAMPDLVLPQLDSLGLSLLLERNSAQQPRAGYGRMQERSPGKDTTTGHWEMAGATLEKPFAIFESFPEKLVHGIEREAEVKFIGNYAGSGTTILSELGAEHIKTGHPLLYTSADSVLQIAAHEQVIPIARLYEICEIARAHADAYRIGRVIARPFEGEPGHVRRTARRHDVSMKPPRTVLNVLTEAGINVTGIGKISDIFAGEGVTESIPTESNADGMEKISRVWSERDSGFIFANLVDFDMLFGHRRDVAGYANSLSEFDTALGKLIPHVNPEDLVIITADHGNDPTFRGTDHTREQVPLFVLHRSESRNLGTRKSFADIAATLADYFAIAGEWARAESFLAKAVA